MLRGRALFALVSMSILCCGLLACGGPTEEELQAAKTAEDWAKLQETNADFEAKRAELAGVKEQLAAAESEGDGGEGESEGDGGEGESEGDGGEGEGDGGEGEAPPTPEQLTIQADALQEEVFDVAEKLATQAIQFINDQGIVEGAELTEMQLGAFRMKSEVDMLFAEEYIESGGDYAKALEIYDLALRNDPDNEKLQQAKASAEASRYMTKERLDQVKKGMTDEEVRALLGTPKSQYVREFEGNKIGWFYPKEEPKTAAGVYFDDKKGTLTVYETDFDAIKAEDEEG